MEARETQQSISQEEERDLLQEALKNYDPAAPPSKAESDRIKKNLASVAYYKSNKEKITESRRAKKADIAREKCRQEGIPEYFAECIQFRSNGEIYLVFKTTAELKKVLHWIKFKSRFGEDIVSGKQ